MDISNSLKGFSHDVIYNQVRKHLESLKSTDVETLYLTAGLIYEDNCLLNLIKVRFGQVEYHYFNYLLSVILSESSSESVRYTYLVRVTKVLVKLYKGIKIDLFDHGSKQQN